MAQERLRSKKHKKKKVRWRRVFGTVFLLIVLGIAGYLYSIYGHAKETVDEKMAKDVESIDTSKAQAKIKNKELLNVLLLGVDERSEDGGRSDSLMVLSLNPKQEKTTIVSIPRDTLTEIAGKGIETKINHAYAYGGADMSVATVENMLDIDLDYYVELNMEGLADLINAIGGVDVYNEIEWFDEGYYKKGYHYELGNIHLDGDQALGYVRMRRLDPRGDFGRTERQRKVINAMIKKGKSMATVTNLNNLIDAIGDNMQTNLSFTDMKALLLGYLDVTKDVESYMIQGENATIDGIYYYAVSDEELQNVHNMLLGLGNSNTATSLTERDETIE
jgi:LCP family protein required for cell wall assembly